MDVDYVGYIMAAGALGVAAAGLVEAIKIDRIKEIGFSKLVGLITQPVIETLGQVYGASYLAYLKSLYRENRRNGKLKSMLRQGFRIALAPQTAAVFSAIVPTVDTAGLTQVAQAINAGRQLDTTETNLLGRFEVAMDARIEAALASADERYSWTMRAFAFVIAVTISLGVAAFGSAPNMPVANYGLALVIGLAAVPLAPIANDLVAGINAARKLLEARQ